MLKTSPKPFDCYDLLLYDLIVNKKLNGPPSMILSITNTQQDPSHIIRLAAPPSPHLHPKCPQVQKLKWSYLGQHPLG